MEYKPFVIFIALERNRLSCFRAFCIKLPTVIILSLSLSRDKWYTFYSFLKFSFFFWPVQIDFGVLFSVNSYMTYPSSLQPMKMLSIPNIMNYPVFSASLLPSTPPNYGVYLMP